MERKKLFTYVMGFMLITTALFGATFTTYMLAPASAWKSLDLTNRYIWLPDIVGGFFNGKVINLHFRMSNKEVLDVCGTARSASSGVPAGISLPSGIYSLSWSVCDKWDYDVTMTDMDALALATSKSPIRTFSSLMVDGDIHVIANGDANRQRFNYAAQAFPNIDSQEVPKSIRDYFGQFKGN